MNEDFYQVTDEYFRSNADSMSARQLQICLDIEKLNQSFMSEETKQVLSQCLQRVSQDESQREPVSGVENAAANSD